MPRNIAAGPRPRSRYTVAAGAVGVAWAMAAIFLVPWLIGSAYRGESLPFLNSLIRGQQTHPVAHYLGIWTQAALAMSATAAMVVACLPGAMRLRHRFRDRDSSLFPVLSRRDTLLSAGVAAICGGLLEATATVVRRRMTHEPTGDVITGEIFWMGPVAALAVLGSVCLLLLVLERVTQGRLAASRLAPLVCWALTWFGLLTVVKLKLIPVAAWALALGLASLVVRALSVSVPEFSRSAPRFVWLTAAVLSAWGFGLPVSRRMAERRGLAALPAAEPGRPNVLVLIWDTARAANMSLYGYARATTPNVARFAERGVTFERAFATSPWSLPSHASMFTGRYPHEMSTGFRIPLDGTQPTIGESMMAAGYATASFSANLFYGSAEYGIGRGFMVYDVRPPVEPAVISVGWYNASKLYEWARLAVGNHQRMQRRRASHVNSTFFEWMDRQGGRPFFAVLNHFDAHEPYLPPAPFDTSFSKRGQRYWLHEQSQQSLDPQTLRDLRDTYDSSIRYLDHEFQRLVDGLAARGQLDNTIVILTADHGEEFGEHDPAVYGHMKSLYSSVLHVPLVLVAPGRVAAGLRRRSVVSIRDIPATVLDLTGVKAAGDIPGISLAAIARDTSTLSAGRRFAVLERHPWGTRPSWPSAKGDLYAAIDDTFHLISAPRQQSLFNLDRDYWELNDLAGSEPVPLSSLRQALDSTFGPPGRRRPRTGSRP